LNNPDKVEINLLLEIIVTTEPKVVLECFATKNLTEDQDFAHPSQIIQLISVSDLYMNLI
jgi:hypothetical protein